MSYREEKMNEYAEIARRNGYSITSHTIEKITYLVSENETVTLLALNEATQTIADRFPDFDVCISVFEDGTEKEYWLDLRHQQKEIELLYSWSKNQCELNLFRDKDIADVFKNNPDYERIKHLFKQFVEDLPEYRCGSSQANFNSTITRKDERYERIWKTTYKGIN